VTSTATGTEVRAHEQSDGYRSAYRYWGAPDAADVVIHLHGGVSHAGWQAPLGERLAARGDIAFAALDRRGSGLNQDSRGHLPSEQREIEDVVSFLRAQRAGHRRLHLAGWCFGAQVATVAAVRAADERLVDSMVMIAPGFAFTERYTDVLSLSVQAAFDTAERFGVRPEETDAWVPVPLQPTDFSADAGLLRWIEQDDLRLRTVTASTMTVWHALADRSLELLPGLRGLPVLAVFGARDRLVDNQSTRRIMTGQLTDPAPEVWVLDAQHAVQFEQPDQLVDLIARFIARLP
jgi:pimeloyl-ACP methyl ester carboxylesterase